MEEDQIVEEIIPAEDDEVNMSLTDHTSIKKDRVVLGGVTLLQSINYRLQRSCGQGNIFAPVCHSVHRGVCLSACWDTTPGKHTPPEAHPPREAHPSRKHPSPPRSAHPPEAPPREADSGIRSMSGRYASYWNAFLFNVIICS